VWRTPGASADLSIFPGQEPGWARCDTGNPILVNCLSAALALLPSVRM